MQVSPRTTRGTAGPYGQLDWSGKLVHDTPGEVLRVNDAPAHSADMLPIVRLVRERVAGRDLRPFAKERDIAYSTIRYYHDEHLPPLAALPRLATRQKLADALRVSVERIEEAAMASLEGRYNRTEGAPSAVAAVVAGPSIEEAIRNADDLLPEAKEHLLMQVALLRRIDGPAPVSLPERRARGQMRKVLDEVEKITPKEPPPGRGGPGGRRGSRGDGR